MSRRVTEIPPVLLFEVRSIDMRDRRASRSMSIGWTHTHAGRKYSCIATMNGRPEESDARRWAASAPCQQRQSARGTASLLSHLVRLNNNSSSSLVRLGVPYSVAGYPSESSTKCSCTCSGSHSIRYRQELQLGSP